MCAFNTQTTVLPSYCKTATLEGLSWRLAGWIDGGVGKAGVLGTASRAETQHCRRVLLRAARWIEASVLTRCWRYPAGACPPLTRTVCFVRWAQAGPGLCDDSASTIARPCGS